MAVTATPYNALKSTMLLGTAKDLTASNKLKVSLHTSSYTPDIDADNFFDDVTNEVTTGSGYTTGGEIITTPSVTLDTSGDFSYLDADDTTWTALTKTFRYAVVRWDSGSAGTSPLLWLIDFGTNQSPAGVDFTLSWAAAGSGGLLKVA